MAVRFHLDEHVDEAIALGLRRRGIDVSTTVEAGLMAATDLEHVQFARRESESFTQMTRISSHWRGRTQALCFRTQALAASGRSLNTWS